MKAMARRALALGSALTLLAGAAQATPIVVFGPDPVAPFSGTVVSFEGQAEGTLIDTQFPGVTFSQPDGGRPQIDNLPAMFGYGPGSGVGMLTGSTEGGAPFPTVAGLIAAFDAPVARAGAFFSDTAPLGEYMITAFDSGGVEIESVTLSITDADTDYGDCGDFPGITGCGLFVGIEAGSAIIASIQFGPSTGFGDAFAIDDVRWDGGGGPTLVPAPATVALLGLGLLVLAPAARRRAHR